MNEKTIKKINGMNVEGYTHFIYDGCHKFWLLKSDTLPQNFKDNGWEQSDVYPIDTLPDMFSKSCPLRFIDDAETHKVIVPQCIETATFRNFGHRNYRIKFGLETQKEVW